MSFARDLRTGRIAEKLIATIFSRNDIVTDACHAISHDLGFTFEGVDRLAEVKYDLYAAKSGNMAVEYYNPKLAKASGIEATKSDVWIVVFSDLTAYAAKTPELLAYTRNVSPHRHIPAGGDGNASLKLYRADDIVEKLFLRIDDLEKGGFENALRELLRG